jgi:hypothetical protein
MAKIKFRRDTAAAWTDANPTLAQGEPGFEHDTGLLKIGDGETAWNSLDYASGGSSSLTDDKAVTVTVGNTDYFAIVNRANNDDNGVESGAVAYDSEGNIIVLHLSEVDTGPNNVDRLIISKFDSTATLIWQKQIQEDMDPTSQSYDICIDNDDNIIVVCSRDGADDTVQVIKYTSAGTEQWKKDYHPAVVVPIYNSVTLLNTTITTGTFQSAVVDVVTLDYNESSSGAFTGWSLQESSDSGGTWTTIAAVLGIGAYDTNAETTPLYLAANSGVTLSQEPGYEYRITRQGANSYLELASAVTDGTHTFIAAVYEEDGNEEFSVSYLMKISNSTGSLEWAKTFVLEEIEAFPNRPYGMEIDSNGDLVMVGAQYTPGPTISYVAKFSGTSGAEVWTRILSNEEGQSVGGDVTADSQGNVFVSINARINIVHENDNTLEKTAVYITKLNSSGVIQWTRRVGPGPCASVGTGIDCDNVGNVYLSALTTTQKNPTRDTANEYGEKDVLAIAKYSTSGAVLWQRYIEADGYDFYQSRNANNGTSNFTYDTNTGRNLAISTTGKIAVQVTVEKRDLDDDVPNTRYYESITFQIDQDGREMTIGSGDDKFAVKESRIPGKFVTLIDLESEEEGGGGPITPTVTDITADIEVTTPVITYADAELAQYIIKSAPYEYVFGNDGTLTIPNDGDVKLTQTQIGWFSIFGPANNDNDDIWIRANCVDPDTGDVYVVGVDRDSGQGFVARYNSQGEILWSIRLVDDDNNNNTRCNAVKLHPSNGNLVVLAEYYGNETGALLLQIDPDTAQVVNDLGFRDQGEDNGVEAYDFDFFTNDDVVVVGRKYDEWTSIPVTAQTGSTTSTLYVLNSELPAGLNTSWYVGGTGITGRTSIDNINFYTPLTGTTQQGSGAVFDIINNGNGTYSVGIVNSGTNYLVGHKIKILGTSLTGAETAVTYTAGVDYPTLSVKRGTDSIVVSSTLTSIIALLDTGTVLTNIDNLSETLTITGPGVENEGNLVYPTTGTVTVSPGTEIGQFTLGAGTYGTGATPDNDIIITVDAVEAGVITSVSNSGTAAGTFTATASGVSGTNYLVGSGADFYIQYDLEGNLSNYGIWNEVGQNYVVGDVITIAGTAFAGGATPTNDATITVTAIGVSGDLQNPITVGGTFPTTQTRITTGGSIDFGGVGSWSLEVPLGGEGFVWTANWNKTVGSTNYDANERYYSVAVGSDNSIYAVGEIYPNGSTSYFKAVVSKFNSTGTHQWSRALNTDTFGASAKGVAVRGTTVAVSSYDNAVGTVITKLDTSGNIKWQRRTDSGDDSSVAIDTNGDIYAVVEANLENKYESIIKAIRFASNGEPIWRKFFGTLTSEYGGTNEYFKNGRNITLDAEHFYVSGYTTAFADDYESGFLVKLPKAGDCDGYYGGWTVQTEAYDVDKVIGSQAGTFTPEVSTGEFETWEPVFTTDWYDPSDNDYYQTLQPIVDRDGGAIEFADGTRQTSSAQQIPQHKISNGADHRLCLDDMGKHIYITDSNTRIHVPYHQDNPLPIGFTVVIINNSGSTISIDADGGSLDIVVPGVSTSQYWDLDSPGMATLIKVTEYTWFMTGNVQVD